MITPTWNLRDPTPNIEVWPVTSSRLSGSMPGGNNYPITVSEFGRAGPLCRDVTGASSIRCTPSEHLNRAAAERTDPSQRPSVAGGPQDPSRMHAMGARQPPGTIYRLSSVHRGLSRSPTLECIPEVTVFVWTMCGIEGISGRSPGISQLSRVSGRSAE
jgi:hypothetical protein